MAGALNSASNTLVCYQELLTCIPLKIRPPKAYVGIQMDSGRPVRRWICGVLRAKILGV